MANSLRDQLLKAGLVTQKQIDDANQPKPKNPARPANTKTKHPGRPQSPDNQPTNAPPKPTTNQRPTRPAKPATKPDELEQFYKARESVERAERIEEERRQREIAARRKQTREQINTLIKTNVQNIEEADIRYNFVVGENIKYVYVTEAQQTALANGELAITFMEGKRCLIPTETAQAILALDPDKIIVINTTDSAAVVTDISEPQA